MKALMWAVFTLETLQIGLAIGQLYNFTTNQHRDAGSLLSGSLSDMMAPLPVGLIASLVQGYLLSRASKLFRRRAARYVFLGLMACPLMLALAGSVWTSVASIDYTYHGYETVGGLSYNAALAMWQWSSAFVDVSVSATLVILLKSHIASFNNNTDTVLRSLINLGIRTGAYTSLVAVAGAITATAFPANSSLLVVNSPQAFWLPLGGLYTLSLLATLSSRTKLRQDLTNGGGADTRRTIQVDVDVAVSCEGGGAREVEIGSKSRRQSVFNPLGTLSSLHRHTPSRPAIGMGMGVPMGMPVGFEEGAAAKHVISFDEGSAEKPRGDHLV